MCVRTFICGGECVCVCVYVCFERAAFFTYVTSPRLASPAVVVGSSLHHSPPRPRLGGEDRIHHCLQRPGALHSILRTTYTLYSLYIATHCVNFLSLSLVCLSRSITIEDMLSFDHCVVRRVLVLLEDFHAQLVGSWQEHKSKPKYMLRCCLNDLCCHHIPSSEALCV